MKKYYYVDDAGYITFMCQCPDHIDIPEDAFQYEEDIPECPNKLYRFDTLLWEWKDPRDLNEVKEEKWTEIKAQRNTQEKSGFWWDGSFFDSDAISQSRIQGAVQLATLALGAGEPFEIGWTLADNSVRSLSSTEMIQVGQAMAGHIYSCHEQGRQLRALIEAATTKEEVEAITWNSLV